MNVYVYINRRLAYFLVSKFFFCGVTLTIVGSESKAASATSWPLFVFLTNLYSLHYHFISDVNLWGTLRSRRASLAIICRRLGFSVSSIGECTNCVDMLTGGTQLVHGEKKPPHFISTLICLSPIQKWRQNALKVPRVFGLPLNWGTRAGVKE